jgi:hypothetical protein
LTWARRYALFILLGIAGEYDLDAPDLDGDGSDGLPRASGIFRKRALNPCPGGSNVRNY